MSSTAEGFTGGGGGGGGFVYHVPQHSRREKLRFPADETGTSSVGLLYQSNGGGGGGFDHQQELGPSAAGYNENMEEECGAHHQQQQIPAQGFCLSLSPAATVGPLGPFTGYAAVLNRSGFVEPARQLLEEICRQLLGRGGAGVGDLILEDMRRNNSMDDQDIITMEETVLIPPLPLEEDQDHHWKKLKLVSMLDQVYRRYRLYYQQVETVITSFETVAGLNSAAPYVSLALKSMSKNFKSLKNLISNHLNNLDKVNGKEGFVGKGEFTGFSLIATGDHTCSQRRNSSFSFGQPQVWRPQRGLPERAVAVLRAWLFEHFLHPYPTDTDKQMLAKQTGLTRNQVSNWFINARVRLWKPMVEEIHNLELHQKLQQQETLILTTADDRHNNNVKNSSTSCFQPSSSSSAATSSSINRPAPVENNINFVMMQRNKLEEQLQLPHHHHHHHHNEEEPYKFVFDDDHFVASHHHHHPVGNVEIGSANSVVSLTLGLPDQVPLSAMNLNNVARRFGLEECSNAAAAAYVLAGFEGGQDRHAHHYGKEIIGAHLLHDFVG